MTRKLRIFLADLTHTYISLATGTFPLGLAYVASALRKIFGKEIELELFKYPDDLNTALQERLPDVFFFSNYVWNQNLNLEYARRIKMTNRSTLVVGGGPNISRTADKQEAFLRKTPFVDFWILNEGELASCYLVGSALALHFDISKLKETNLLSTLTLLPAGKMKLGPLAPRLGVPLTPNEAGTAMVLSKGCLSGLRTLDDVPSPYLSGLMDKFFDDRLYPLIETNRGCPFTCSFCQQGTSYFNRMAFRSPKHCREEFEFIAGNMVKRSPRISRVEIADANFAMFKNDLEFCDFIRKIQDKYSWPHLIGCSTGKNKPEQVLDAVSKLLPDSLVISNSMQSTNPETLSAIKRSNISLDGYKRVQAEIHKRGLRSMADVILCLPKETKESHFDAVMKLIDSGVQEFTSYQAMILKGTELELEEMHERYGIRTKYRILPRGIGEYPILGENAILLEVERIAAETNTLSFDEYLEARRLHLITMIYHNSGVFEIVQKFLTEQGIPISRLIKEIVSRSFLENWPLKKVFDNFIAETRSELFDSEKEAILFCSTPENLARVKRAEIGGNLLWKYLAVTFFEYWSEAGKVLMEALRRIAPMDDIDFHDFSEFLNARIVNISETPIRKDISLKIKSAKLLDLLGVSAKLKEQAESVQSVPIKMVISDHKYRTLTHAKTCYQNNRTGWSLILAVHRVHTVIREVAVPRDVATNARSSSNSLPMRFIYETV